MKISKEKLQSQDRNTSQTFVKIAVWTKFAHSYLLCIDITINFCLLFCTSYVFSIYFPKFFLSSGK